MKNILAIFCVVFLMTAHHAAACVGCREPGSDTVANEPQTVMAGFGFSWGVIIMLVCAISIVTGITAYIWRTIVRIERQREGL
jgi:magnesium-transporting ATPase (P-type)